MQRIFDVRPSLGLLTSRLQARWEALLRIALSQYVTNGLSVSLGLVLIMLALFELAGLAAAASAAVGVIISSLPDVPSPRRRKVMQVLPAPLLGAPLFLLVQLTRDNALLLGVVLAAGTFLAVMAMAWGKRGGPICFALLFSMLFSMAAPPMPTLHEMLLHTAWFTAGAGLYLLWAVLTAKLLNQRFRTQQLAECLHSFSMILRTQAQRFGPSPDHQALLAAMLDQQANFADQLQDTRNLVLESPTTRLRQQYAGMLLCLLEARDHQLACDLDLDALTDRHAGAPDLLAMQQALVATADALQALGLAMLLFRRQKSIQPIAGLAPSLAAGLQHQRTEFSPSASTSPAAQHGASAASTLLQNLADRIGSIYVEAVKIAALACGDAAAELSLVRGQWQLFVGATTWSSKPLLGQLGWRAPTLRHAIRAMLAVAVGYTGSLFLPWATHEYWILITIVVVMRGNLAQTVQRRNARVAGTLLGCLLVMALLWGHPGAKVLFLVIALSTGIAHAFALRRYLYTSIAATVSGLLQAHLLLAGLQPTFAVGERLADTLIGALLAWAFSYVLPSWERNQIPGLVRRSLQAQSQHALQALALLATSQKSDLDWRLARREAFDSLSALTLATQRSLAEPRKVRPLLEPLEHLQARSYQLLAQLTAIKSMLLLRRSQLDLAVAEPALANAAKCIAAELADVVASAAPLSAKSSGTAAVAPGTCASTVANAASSADFTHEAPDPTAVADLTPWLLRRLQLACAIAGELRLSASQAVR